MAIPSGVTNAGFETARQSLYELQGWLQEDENRSVQIACEYWDTQTQDLIAFYSSPQDALGWVDGKEAYVAANWVNWPLGPRINLSYTDLTVDQQPITPPPPPIDPPPPPPPPPPPILPPDPVGFPGNLTTDSYQSARNSLTEAQNWLNGDPNRRIKVTVTCTTDPLNPNPHDYYGTEGAFGWVDGIEAYGMNSSPPTPMMMSLAYTDMTGVAIPPPIENLPAAKELPESLKSISTMSAAALQSFANDLYNWSTTGGTGCVIGSCSLSPPQPGFANTWPAPDLNSLVSWISGVQQYIADGVPVTASITVTSVSCGGA